MNGGCTCGCGKSREQVISEIMASPAMLNRDQAEAQFDAAQAARLAKVGGK